VGISEIGYNPPDVAYWHFQTLRDVRLESGMRTKADVRPRLWIYGLHWRRKILWVGQSRRL